MATITKRKDNGRYMLSYIDPIEQKRKKMTIGHDEDMAELYLKKAEEQIALAKLGVIDKIVIVVEGQEKKGKKAELTLSVFKKKYEDRCRKDIENSESTIKNNNLALRSLISAIGDKVMEEVTDEDILQWKEATLRQMSRASVASYFRHLRSAFNRAFKWKMITNNPFFYVDSIKEQKEDRIKKKHMSVDEVRQLFRTIEEKQDFDFLHFVYLVAYLGVRRIEAITLRWEDIDLGRKVAKIYQKKTKREIELPIGKALLRIIEGMEIKKTGYIFQTKSMRNNYHKTDRHWSPDFVTHKFRTYLKAAGLPLHFKLHSMRHTFSTFLTERGVSREIVQKLLGHSSVRTTEIYDHSIALHFREYVDMVDFEEGEEAK